MKKKSRTSIFLSFILLISIFLSSFGIQANAATSRLSNTVNKPKYIFLFIGDGMGQGQINAAQVYLSSKNKNEVNLKQLEFTKLPIAGGMFTEDLTSFCPDSSSTATAMSSGYKTYSSVLGLKGDKKSRTDTIAEKMKKSGYKVGVVSSVPLNNATPAAFYSHVPSRSMYNEIAMQMAKSNFDYFGGGSLLTTDGKDSEEFFKLLEGEGYKIVREKSEILRLNNSLEKVYAISPKIQDSMAIPYRVDSSFGALELRDFVKKGIDVLENDKGFFMMVESGKIDWACHANDGKTAIEEVVALDKAVEEAISFYNRHPKETLILVTADHETGGISIGNRENKYDTHFELLEKQKVSHVAFNEYIDKYKEENKGKENFNDILRYIEDNFGLVTKESKLAKRNEYKNLILTDVEYNSLENAFNETLNKDKSTLTAEEKNALYGNYEPLSIITTGILNKKAGIGWTSYAHTGMPVNIYGLGVGAENFTGYYENTELFKKLVNLLEL